MKSSPYAIGRRWRCEPAGRTAFEFVIVGKGSRPDRKLCRLEYDNTSNLAPSDRHEYTHKHLKKYGKLVAETEKSPSAVHERPMNSKKYRHYGKPTRMFFGDDASADDIDAALARPYFSDNDDRARHRMLTRMFDHSKIVMVFALPVVDAVDEVHVFIAGQDTAEGYLGVFACVVVSQRRLRELSRQASTINETFTFQVADAPRLTPRTTALAIAAWIERNYSRNVAFVLLDERPPTEEKIKIRLELKELPKR